MIANLQSFASQLAFLPRTLRIVWAASRRWTLAWAILLVVQGLLPAATVYLTGLLVDSVAAALGGGTSLENIWPTVFLGALMAGVMLLTQVLQSLMEWVRTAQAEYLRDYVSVLIHDKVTRLDLAFFESPKYHDRLFQARNDLHSRPLALLENGGSLLQNSITLLAMATLLFRYGWWVPLVLLVGTAPAFLVVLKFNRRYHRWWEKTTADRRWVDYFDTVLVVDVAAAELRLFDLGAHFQSAFQNLRRRLRSERLQLVKKQSMAGLAAGIWATLIAGGTMAWMVWQAFLGLVTLGDVAVFNRALFQGQGLLRALLGNLGQIYSNTLFLGNLFEFLELEGQVVEPAEPVATPATLEEGIRFRHVTFRYPGSDRAVLQDFDFVIPAGKVVAIVGANGAGKTTLVKLLCRFYDPEAGSIEFDGTDIKRFSLGSLRRMITVLFQFPVRYFSTVGENIAMGDLAAKSGATEIETAARGAGAQEFIEHLPQGYDTLLGKWFTDGTELSGGEWQRLALARAFLRQAQVMILDEPTSFMDSWTEIDWFDRFLELAKGRTAIIISHRFMIAKRADIIHVMKSGRVVESGSHEELLTQGGLYAQSWTAQIKSSADRRDSIETEPDVVPGTASKPLFPADARVRDNTDAPWK